MSQVYKPRNMKPEASHFSYITEKQFQQQVLELATLCHWDLQYHTFDSRRSTQGFPDLVLLRGTRLVFAELKSESGILTPEQWEWLEALQRQARAITSGIAGWPTLEVYLWQPHDIEEIERVLRCS